MCGIVGFIDRSLVDDAPKIVRAMRALVAHRGPDMQGEFLSADVGLALGHARLSIIDLSIEGRQPMASPSGRYTMVYNGEVYNFDTLRRELEGHGFKFRGHSDTEVLLASIEHWGLHEAVRRWNGMFACAIFDAHAKSLSLVRDSFGIKPLFYGFVGDAFVFASELKAFWGYPKFEPTVDFHALAAFCRVGYVPGPLSIFSKAHKLVPGTILTVRCDRISEDARDFSPYVNDAAACTPKSFEVGKAVEVHHAAVALPSQLVEQAEVLLRDAVRSQMVADVPVGAFLSGGIDSSLIVALMQKCAPGKVHTFSVGFEDQRYDESADAERIAAHLGTVHHRLQLQWQDCLSVIPKLAAVYDEPFADSSQIPTLLVSQLARQHVTVALSGDGGDEIFGGYNRYRWAEKVVGLQKGARGLAIRKLSSLLLHIPPHAWRVWYPRIRRLVGVLPELRDPGFHIHKLADALTAKTPQELYLKLVAQCDQLLVPASVGRALDPIRDFFGRKNDAGSAELFMNVDALTYLPDDILVKVDRATMQSSLEARVPFLDKPLVQFARSLPVEMKIRGHETKWILRQILKKYLPTELINRTKWGFGVPIDEWLRGPLRPWAEERLAATTSTVYNVVNRKELLRRWQEHQDRRRDWQYALWNVLVAIDWLERGKVSRASPELQMGA